LHRLCHVRAVDGFQFLEGATGPAPDTFTDQGNTYNLTNVGVQQTTTSFTCNGTDLAPYSVLFGSNSLKLNVTDGSTIAPADPTARLKLRGVFALSLTEVSGLMGCHRVTTPSGYAWVV